MSKRSHLGVWNKSEIGAAIQSLMGLRSEMVRLGSRSLRNIRELRSNQRNSAANLIHYLALRAHDLRKLQERLSEIGVSSLGRSEGHILDDVDRVLGILRRLQHSASSVPAVRNRRNQRASVLETRMEALLEPKPDGRTGRIIVTVLTA